MDDKISRADQLASAYSEERGKLRMTSNVEGEYEDLLSQCRILETLRDNHVQKIQELQMQVPEGLRIHVLEEAVAAAEADSVQTARVLGIGLVAGLMLGGGLAFVRDWRDQTVRSADEIMAILGVPMLGAIPKVPRRRALVRGKNVGFTPNSRESEACRAIRTALFFGASQQQTATVLVTSPGAQEGKTTLVSNLAIAMARAGQKTLVVDADLRKPMQKRIFAMTGADVGLTDLLSGTAQLDEAIRPTQVEGLDVLASGRRVPNPSEMLNSSALQDVLGQLKERYDRIIIDSPPVGVVTDGQILATMCDLTLIVLRARHSTRQVTQRARDALQTVGAHVAGAVVNDVSRRDRRYSHYSGYGYYYGGRRTNAKPAGKQLPAEVASDAKDDIIVAGPDYWEKMFRQS
jgi:capsular exopolysaccharide synthesis family protein